ncbi:hypothetical protein LIER_18562 [Lithospermum erythrorhizon]|uniref:Uncharacterized protein n=1 Tax=Lithospermum erythrorhizon TaxID=34254 RepID=A0AAV3QH09_LITER
MLILPRVPAFGLLTRQEEDSKDFRAMIRTHNKNHFAFSSMSIHCDDLFEKRNRRIYTVRVQGQIHHFLNDLVPFGTSTPMHTTLTHLVIIMEPNPYSMFLRSLTILDELERYCTVIKSDSTLDKRVYDKPTSFHVAGVWIENDGSYTMTSHDRDIRVYAKSSLSHNIQCYYACYDPLQYVLMFPAGDPGWHFNILFVG